MFLLLQHRRDETFVIGCFKTKQLASKIKSKLEKQNALKEIQFKTGLDIGLLGLTEKRKNLKPDSHYLSFRIQEMGIVEKPFFNKILYDVLLKKDLTLESIEYVTSICDITNTDKHKILVISPVNTTLYRVIVDCENVEDAISTAKNLVIEYLKTLTS